MTTPLACLPRKGCLSVHRPNLCARSAGSHRNLLSTRRFVWLFFGQTSGWYGRGGGLRHTLLSFRASGREGYRVPLSFLCAAVTRRDGLLVFGMGVGTLPTPLAYLDVTGFFPVAFDAVAFQHQMTMVDTDITGKSAGGYSALSAYLRSREVGGSI